MSTSRGARRPGGAGRAGGGGKVAPRPSLFNLRPPLLAALLAALPAWVTPPPAMAAPPAAPDDARGSLALYCAESCGELQLDGFALRARLPLTAARPVVTLTDVTDRWPRPDEARLAAWGEGDVAGMPEADEIVLLEWAVPAEEGAPRFARLAAAAAEAATWVEDPDTGRLLDLPRVRALAAAAAAPDIDVAELIVIEAHAQADGSTSLVTAGMHRLGLPDLIDAPVPSEEIATRAARLNAIAQAIYEEGLDTTVHVDAARFASPSARRAACGLTGTATLALVHDGGFFGSGAGVRAALRGFDGDFGACGAGDEPPGGEPDPGAPAAAAAEGGDAPAAPGTSTTGAAATPAAVPADASAPGASTGPAAATLQRVQAAALARLRGPVADAWAAGLPAGDRLMVKAPFQSMDGRVAWLWMQVDEWSADDVLSGPLLSDPPVGVGVRKGEIVQAPLDLVFDYIWQHADGRTEGNTTQRFL